MTRKETRAPRKKVRKGPGEVELASIRETMRGCALTEDECDAFGIDFNQHHADLIDPAD